MKFLIFSLLSAGALFSAESAPAVYDRLPLSAAEGILKDLDLDAEEIEHGVWRIKIQDYTVVFYNQFDRVQLFAGFSGFKSDLETINSWNQARRFSRAYLDENGDPCLESDLNIRGGVTAENLRYFFKIFDASLKLFTETLKK